MSDKFEDELWNMVDACIDHSEYIEKLKALLNEHITENESGALVSPHIMSKELQEFLDD